MTAGKDAPLSHELAAHSVAQRLASFAAGCLGTSSPVKTAHRLGVMGNVSEAELREILQHIEVLSKQRAAALAGNSGYPETGTDRSSSFQKALKEACGVDLDHIHLYLPKDAMGKVDLIQIFRMDDGKAAGTSTAPQSMQAVPMAVTPLGCDAFADFVDQPSDLPKTDELPRLSQEVDQALWLQDTVAINAVRSALYHKVPIAEVDALLLPLSKRCRSRRPALSKTALRALAELAAAPDFSIADTWISAGAEIMAACLAAMQVTKVTAKLGEETLDALCRRLQTDATTARVLQVLSGLECAEVKHPICVAAVLRVMGSCLGRAGSEEVGDSADASAFCEEVLKNRRLSPAFSEARAVLRQLKDMHPSAHGNSGI